MNAPMSDRSGEDVEKKYDNPDAPSEVNSQRSGLAEADSMGSQADVLSPDGTRMDAEMTREQADTLRNTPHAP